MLNRFLNTHTHIYLITKIIYGDGLQGYREMRTGLYFPLQSFLYCFIFSLKNMYFVKIWHIYWTSVSTRNLRIRIETLKYYINIFKYKDYVKSSHCLKKTTQQQQRVT